MRLWATANGESEDRRWQSTKAMAEPPRTFARRVQVITYRIPPHPGSPTAKVASANARRKSPRKQPATDLPRSVPAVGRASGGEGLGGTTANSRWTTGSRERGIGRVGDESCSMPGGFVALMSRRFDAIEQRHLHVHHNHGGLHLIRGEQRLEHRSPPRPRQTRRRAGHRRPEVLTSSTTSARASGPIPPTRNNRPAAVQSPGGHLRFRPLTQARRTTSAFSELRLNRAAHTVCHSARWPPLR